MFVVATANDVTQLPPELLRMERFDELWFVDLPTAPERESIWMLVIQRHDRDAEQFDVPQLARITDGFTGSEIESAFTEAVFLSFAQDGEPTDLDIARVLNEFVPLAKQTAEQINGLRQWAKGRARPAPPDRPAEAGECAWPDASRNAPYLVYSFRKPLNSRRCCSSSPRILIASSCVT